VASKKCAVPLPYTSDFLRRTWAVELTQTVFHELTRNSRTLFWYIIARFIRTHCHFITLQATSNGEVFVEYDPVRISGCRRVELTRERLLKTLLLLTPHYISFCHRTMINMLSQPASKVPIRVAASLNRLHETPYSSVRSGVTGESNMTIHSMHCRPSRWYLRHHPFQARRLLPPTSSMSIDSSLGRRRNLEICTFVCTARRGHGRMDTRVMRDVTCGMPIHL
jgi:hypothetical protein